MHVVIPDVGIYKLDLITIDRILFLDLYIIIKQIRSADQDLR